MLKNIHKLLILCMKQSINTYPRTPAGNIYQYLQKYQNCFIQRFGPMALYMPDEGHGTETLNKVILILLQVLLVCGTFFCSSFCARETYLNERISSKMSMCFLLCYFNETLLKLQGLLENTETHIYILV